MISIKTVCQSLGIFALLSFSLGLLATAAAVDLKPFAKDSMKTIEAAYHGKPFLLVLWSIDCTPCRAELKLLGELRQAHPDMNLVLIATDDMHQQKKLSKILTRYQLGNVDNWAFAGQYSELLRHAIDPEWYGELPRSYFYTASHTRTAVSGQLKAQSVSHWLEAN